MFVEMNLLIDNRISGGKLSTVGRKYHEQHKQENPSATYPADMMPHIMESSIKGVFKKSNFSDRGNYFMIFKEKPNIFNS